MLTISGNGFALGDSLTANGATLQLTIVSTNQMTTTIPASMMSAPGNIQFILSDSAGRMTNLVLVVTTPPVAALSSSALSFASQMVNTSSASQSVTISNNGSGPLVISGVTVSGDFSQASECTVIVPGSNCSISVTFKPTTTGIRSGLLTIDDNDASKSQKVTLSGTGIDIQISGAGNSGTNATVKAGQPATYNLSIAPQGGFTGQVTFNCTNLPQYAACNFSPQNLNLGSTAAGLTVTISTAQQQTALLERSGGVMFAGISCAILLASLPLRRRIRNVRFSGTAKVLGVLLAIVLVGLSLTGCNAGGTVTNPTTTPPRTTAQGTYTVNFTATGSGTSRTIPLTLVVQ
jgi:archaellum component FlaF (FlaF/FlaG flagellin family)